MYAFGVKFHDFNDKFHDSSIEKLKYALIYLLLR